MMNLIKSLAAAVLGTSYAARKAAYLAAPRMSHRENLRRIRSRKISGRKGR